jgi:hypothetical protein
VLSADLVIGGVLVPGAAAPKLVTRSMVSRMKKGAVVVDVAIDQGGCFETSHATTHADPTFVVDGVVHYCVANMPGAVARTSTFALNNATIGHAWRWHKGWRQALRDDAHLKNGLNVCQGKVTYAAVAKTWATTTCRRIRCWPDGLQAQAELPDDVKRIRAATDFTKRMKSVAAFSLALSEIVRITPNGIPSSKHTWATAAPSISTANSPGKAICSPCMRSLSLTNWSPLATRPRCSRGRSARMRPVSSSMASMKSFSRKARAASASCSAIWRSDRKWVRPVSGTSKRGNSGTGIHVVLDQGFGHHDVADAHEASPAAGNARKQDVRNSELLHKRGGSHGRGNLANTR